jgi:hypothetical protein
MKSHKDIYSDIAKAFNNNDVSYIEANASDDITLIIKHEVELVVGKGEVIQYLKKRFENSIINKESGLAELAHMGDQSKARQQFTNLYEGDMCLRFPVGILKPHGAILVLEINEHNLVSEICICVLVHSWSAVIGDGVYP